MTHVTTEVDQLRKTFEASLSSVIVNAFSPIVNIEQTENSHILTIRDKFGLKTTEIKDGQKGQKGDIGTGFDNVTMYFATSTSRDRVPTSWQATITNLQLSAINKYLWSYWVIDKTDGTQIVSQKYIIGVYGDKGDKGDKGEQGIKGDTGNGIRQINYYYKTTAVQVAPKPEDIIDVEVPEVSLNQRYLWTKQVIEYTNGNKASYVYLIAVLGQKGEKGQKGDTGEQGPQGIQGQKGQKGDKGQTGQQGIQGPQGVQGIQGPRGQKGEKGDTGTGITSTRLNSDYTLTITLDDGTEYTTQPIRGQIGQQGPQGIQGETGNGISSIVLNNDYTLTINFTDGTNYITSSIRGQKGEKGNTGESGVYIGSVEPEDQVIKVWINDSSENVLKIKNSEDNWIGISSLKGQKGDKGDQGIQGIQGPQGIQGQKGDKGQLGQLNFEDYDGNIILTNGIGVGVNIYICSVEEYDAETRIPIVQNPSINMIYLVPSEQSISPDMFVEWIYTEDGWQMFGSATIDLSDYVKNTDYATSSKAGVVKINGAYGIKMDDARKDLILNTATSLHIKNGEATYNPIVPVRQHESVFYGLAKAAGDNTQSQSDNTVGTYTDEAKQAIKSMFGIIDPTVSDVQINGTSVLNNGIANIPIANRSNLGVVKTTAVYGIQSNPAGFIGLVSADENYCKGASSSFRAIVPSNQHYSTFYGLAKAAGDITQPQSDNEVGTYTDQAKAAIKNMLGVKDPSIQDIQIDGTSVVTDRVANIPIASDNKLGVIKTNSSLGLGINTTTGVGYIAKAATSEVKAGSNIYRPIVPSTIDYATFYGLAKAAGDTTQRVSDNTVGSYTNEAKQAIKNMLGIIDNTTIIIEDTDVVIEGQANTRYLCGQVSSIDITPSESGMIIIRFTTGTTLPAFRLPETVKMPEWFELDTEQIYEICISDGVYGGVMSWPV